MATIRDVPAKVEARRKADRILRRCEELVALGVPDFALDPIRDYAASLIEDEREERDGR